MCAVGPYGSSHLFGNPGVVIGFADARSPEIRNGYPGRQEPLPNPVLKAESAMVRSQIYHPTTIPRPGLTGVEAFSSETVTLVLR